MVFNNKTLNHQRQDVTSKLLKIKVLFTFVLNIIEEIKLGVAIHQPMIPMSVKFQ